MAGLDNNISISVSGAAPPVSAVSFGLVLFVAAAGTLEAGFTERVRTYDSTASAEADEDLSAAAQDAVAACFSQPLHVDRCQVGRVEIDVAQVHTVTITTAADGVWSIPITLFDGTIITASFTASGSAADTAIATGLRAAITTALAVAHDATPSDLTPSGVGAAVIITADVAGNGFTVGTVVDPGIGAHTSVATTASRNIKDGLDAILAENASFYAFSIASQAEVQLERAQAWAEANKKVFLGQTADADVITSATDDIASKAKALNYNQSGVMHHATAADYAAFAWLCFWLQCNPDEKTTDASYRTLSGVTPGTYTSGQLAYMDGKNCNYYSTLKGRGATFPGKLASGLYFDQRLTRDWFKARLEEAFANQLFTAHNANSKIPYTNKGLQALASTAKSIVEWGITAGHFDGAQGYEVTVAKLANVPGADKAAKIARITVVVYEAGSIQKITLTAFVDL